MARVADVIKFEGDSTAFVWKHPCEQFSSRTKLIVHESQEAVFFLNGQALDVFSAGSYVLEPQNIPLIGDALNRAAEDTSPFHCEVYFVNKAEQPAILWGTDSRVQYFEPTYHFPLSIGASGEMSLRAKDSIKLIVNLVGSKSTLDRAELVGYFRAFLMLRVKTHIAQLMNAGAVSIFEVDGKLTELSEQIGCLLSGDFAEYGLTLERFFVTTIIKPDGDEQYEKFKDLHFRRYADITAAKIRRETELINAETEAQKLIIDSRAQAVKREQEGYTYQEQRAFDAAATVAAYCTGCGARLTPNAVYCGNCGKKREV